MSLEKRVKPHDESGWFCLLKALPATGSNQVKGHSHNYCVGALQQGPVRDVKKTAEFVCVSSFFYFILNVI